MDTPDAQPTVEETLERFLARCHRRRYPAKATILYQGDRSDALYYILSGAVTVLREDDAGREIVLAYLNPGDFFGEMGLF
ncbi:MAG: cyclic nucleotide-binding domain-containing protein, partial [Gammaproteobacteria bacterium]|nr:cyclic nucleotide-binding domain-containing protein [Gammaproteobacteria bacterium]